MTRVKCTEKNFNDTQKYKTTASPPVSGSLNEGEYGGLPRESLRKTWTIDLLYIMTPGVFRDKKIFEMAIPFCLGTIILKSIFNFGPRIILGKMKVGTLSSNYHIQYKVF